MAAPPWLVRNYGPRCTLVCAASALRRLGAASSGESLVDMIAAATRFREAYGPPVGAYLGGHSRLDRGIEQAARAGGIEVRSCTRFVVRWRDLAGSLARDLPVVLNCWRAPSRQWSHSVLAVDCALEPRRLLTLDPNDASYRWLTWLRPATGFVCTATFIEPAAPGVGGEPAARAGSTSAPPAAPAVQAAGLQRVGRWAKRSFDREPAAAAAAIDLHAS